MIHLPFENRLEAGRALAAELRSRGYNKDAVALGLARGGVTVAFEVADRLHIPLDVLVVRKIGVPWQPELAMGAIAGNVQLLDRELIDELRVPTEDLEDVIAREEARARRREELYRKAASRLELRGKTAILIDDGLATGTSMVAAVRHVRTLEPAKVIMATPVGSREGCKRLRAEVDDVVCLAVPDRFYAVGEWYREFSEVSDESVEHMLAQNRRCLNRKPGSAAA
jgi:predicted phosphoribosyltransferase